jgi:hypothetical protein
MKALFLFIYLFPCYLFGQHQVKGKVIDQETKVPLAFVTIVINELNTGTITDIDGNFKLNSSLEITSIQLSYVGYKPQKIILNNSNPLLIKMKQTSFALEEFNVLPGINPAERIIKEVIKNRKLHNPEKSLDFKYDSYSKMYFTAVVDTNVLNGSTKVTTLDSNDQQAMDWLEKHHLFMMEAVSERKFKHPDKNYEKVIASRVSGLKNPTFSLIATEFQSFSFYHPTLKVMDKSYLNPITPNSINKYLFLIEDTIFNELDTVFILSFRPRNGKNFDALKGLLYINTDGFALQNVIAEPMNQSASIHVKVQQKYEKIQGSWFPVQLNSTLFFNSIEMGNYKVMGIGKTYLKNIQINPKISKKEFSYVDTEIDSDANKKEEEFWNKYREDTLSKKEQNTYHIIDSVGKAENLDKKLLGLEALLTGKLKWGHINLDLNRFLNYNEYEGTRIGVGLHTNQRVSKWFSLGGYGAYSFNDKEFKYGVDLDFLIHQKNDISLNLAILKDVFEPGITSFYEYKTSLFSAEGSRALYLSRMNNMDKIEARLKFRTLRYLKIYVFANQENIEITNNYYFKKQIDATTIVQDQYYTFNEIGVEFRYAFKEKIIKTLSGKHSKPTNYPIIYGKIQQGVTELNGEYKFTRFTIRAQKQFYLKNIGKPSFSIEAGLIDGNVPQHKLNNALGSNPSSTFKVATENAFETMSPYEFFSSEYIHFHFRHSFGSLLLKMKKFSPEIIVVSSLGFGSLSYAGSHAGESFKTMEKGYYESGLVINKILNLNYTTFGIGTFYRYGAYQHPKQSDNYSVKLSLGFSF